ncbi:hypothetical protein SAMN04487895_10170 [Paenibacillus sophorae]|uniref:Uncharacterized protein n=1 Tax=Paenibacillus sophorae TaxID=1333845 RepID=A0A1H8FC59_9BACL|nr:hypothetical protein SAMN04487895_10170 [Paenibacillus sophorae]
MIFISLILHLVRKNIVKKEIIPMHIKSFLIGQRNNYSNIRMLNG